MILLYTEVETHLFLVIMGNMNYQSAKANWFPTQSVALQFLVRSYTKTVGLYDSSYRYLIFNKSEKYQNDCVIGLGYHPLFNHITNIYYDPRQVN